jgi:glycosyltransferase involved in cell wall biosynthesis
MKICMYSPIFPPQIGGPSTQCFNLCKALVQRGVTPVVITYGNSFGHTELEGFKVYTFRRPYVFGPLDKVIRWIIFPFYIFYILRKEKIDILHCHSVSMLSFIAGLVARIQRIPTVIKFAGDWVWETISTKAVAAKDFKEIYTSSFYARVLTRIEKWGLSFFDIIWTPSQFRKENIEYLLGPKAPIKIIPNCLLLKEGGAKIQSPEQKVIIVSANRFIPHKRVSYLVESYAQIMTSNTRLVLIGGGDPREVEKTKEAIKKYNLQDSVELTGILSSQEVYEKFKQASFYVSVSLEEGFPNVFIEALNYGLPIVATDVGGSKELVWEGETGFLVPVRDQETLVTKMKLLIDDTVLRNTFSKNSYEHSKNYNLSFRVQEFIDMYTTLIRKHV